MLLWEAEFLKYFILPHIQQQFGSANHFDIFICLYYA